MAHSHSHPNVAPFTEWYGFPAGAATCTAVAFSPSTCRIPEEWTISPAEQGKVNTHPILVTLIRHNQTGKLAVFDLGIAKNWEASVPPELAAVYKERFGVQVQADLDEVFADRGFKAEDVETVIISHHHFDHTGAPSLFPRARIIVGPSTASQIPALAAHPSISSLSWDTPSPRVGTFEHTFDVWGDGSLIVVALPGHTTGQVGALVRTSSSVRGESEGEYVLLAADCCHHRALFAPRESEAHFRPGKWREEGEPADEPPSHSMHEDEEEAARSLERVKAAGRREEVLVVLAHDIETWKRWGGEEKALTGVELSGWKEKGLKAE
ncbi:hypothetical protein JCM10449v2_008112 [Rhodotorula kratochvilovae]